MERQGQIVLADGKTQEEVEEQAVALILGEKKPEPGEKETAEKPKKVSAFCNFWREIAVSDMVIGILGLCASAYHHSGARLCARYLRRIVCALQHDVQADVSGIYPVRYLHELHHHAVPALEKRADYV